MYLKLCRSSWILSAIKKNHWTILRTISRHMTNCYKLHACISINVILQNWWSGVILKLIAVVSLNEIVDYLSIEIQYIYDHQGCFNNQSFLSTFFWQPNTRIEINYQWKSGMSCLLLKNAYSLLKSLVRMEPEYLWRFR